MTPRDVQIAVLERCIRMIKRFKTVAARRLVTEVDGVLDGLRAEQELDDAKPPKSFDVEAFIKSDDGNVDGSVEAAAWLRGLDDEDLSYLCVESGPGDATDDLFWWYDTPTAIAGRSVWGRKVVQRVGAYTNMVDDVGFSVRIVKEEQLHAWVQKNRPEAWKLYQKEHGDG